MTKEFYPNIPVLERAALALASASPRRRELLGRLVPSDQFRIISANINEDLKPDEDPADYVRRLALEKAEEGSRLWAVASPTPEERLVLGADTTVVLDNLVLGKPGSKEEAAGMLETLSGKTHRVITGVAALLLSDGKNIVRSESLTISTEVEFQPLSRAEIDWYVATGEPMDKAGAYAVQGYGGTLIAAVRGDYYNVVGLPLAPLIQLLRSF
jgi:septum formation protein